MLNAKYQHTTLGFLILLSVAISGAVNAIAQGPPFGGGPEEMLRRMDRNGDGMLDPSEAQGPARYILDRIARDTGIDTSRPIPIDRLRKEMERMRASRYGSPPPDSRGNNNSRGSSGSSSRTSSSATEPLVPGFGVENEFEPIPGFGSAAELFSVTVEDADLREADERLRRYDRNRDGFLSREEIAGGRWSDDPFQYDRNRDDKLSKNELAVRYARRRLDRDSGSQQRSSSTSSRDSGSSSSGNDDRTNRMLEYTLERYDRNRNGVFERGEWSSFRTDPSAADRNRDGRITKDELRDWMVSRYGGGSSSGRSSASGDRRSYSSGSSRSDSSRGSTKKKADDQKSYRFARASERLPAGLPEWFLRSDTNEDGQVMMREYSTNWTDATADDFFQFDLDRNGIITSQELLAAAENGAQRGAAISSGAPTTREVTVAKPTPGTSPPKFTPTARPSTDSAKRIDPRTLDFFKKVMAKSDTNGDGVLTENEWKTMSRNPEPADTDGDGKVTVAEYARWRTG